MKTDVLLNVLEKNKKNSYSKEDSILKEYDEFLLMNGIYRGFDIMTFRKKLRAELIYAKKYWRYIIKHNWKTKEYLWYKTYMLLDTIKIY